MDRGRGEVSHAWDILCLCDFKGLQRRIQDLLGNWGWGGACGRCLLGLRPFASEKVHWTFSRKLAHPFMESQNDFTEEKKFFIAGLLSSLSSSNSRRSSFWRLVRLTGVSTASSMNMSP